MSPKSDFRLLVTFSCPGKNVTRFKNNNSGDISPRRTRQRYGLAEGAPTAIVVGLAGF
jgi:hypothetical protein